MSAAYDILPMSMIDEDFADHEEEARETNRAINDHLGEQVVGIFTTRYVCTNCKSGFTVPRNESCDGIGECEKCGCTSYTLSQGRPWGPRHRFWKDWVRSTYSLDEQDRVTPDTVRLFSSYIEEIPLYLTFREGTKATP